KCLQGRYLQSSRWLDHKRLFLAFDVLLPSGSSAELSCRLYSDSRSIDISELIFLVDLVFATAGYTLMLRLLDSHLRWAEPTAIGWLVAIVCYEPFWNPIASEYLMYHGPVNWISWLAGFPVLQVVWGSTILFLM